MINLGPHCNFYYIVQTLMDYINHLWKNNEILAIKWTASISPLHNWHFLFPLNVFLNRFNPHKKMFINIKNQRFKLGYCTLLWQLGTTLLWNCSATSSAHAHHLGLDSGSGMAEREREGKFAPLWSLNEVNFHIEHS